MLIRSVTLGLFTAVKIWFYVCYELYTYRMVNNGKWQGLLLLTGPVQFPHKVNQGIREPNPWWQGHQQFRMAGSYCHIKSGIWWIIILHALPVPSLSHKTKSMCAVQAIRGALSPPSGALLFTGFNNHEKCVFDKADNHTSGKHGIVNSMNTL